MTERPLRIAILGAGPIGIEAALEALDRGFDVTVYEAGQIGAHLRQFGHVTLFTPFGMNSTERGRALLRDSGVTPPPDDALLTAGDLVARYLAPLAALPTLSGRVREHSRVTHVGREGTPKTDGIVAVGDRRRVGAPFLLRVEAAGGATAFERADAVLDATGVYATPNATGPGGLPAAGEESLGDRIERHLPDLRGAARERYRGRTVLLVGSGHSAATALVDFEAMRRDGAGPERVDWVVRGGEQGTPFREVPGDPLSARVDLTRRANAVARAPWIVRHAETAVEAYRLGEGGAVRAVLVRFDGETSEIHVDRVLSLTGYRPDMEITRELQVHHCYASEAPMKLATAILAAGSEGAPTGHGDCLSQTTHGPESLRNPEPDFYIVGVKSYGRGANFLLTLGHQQVRDALRLIESEIQDRIAAPSLAP